MGRKRRCVGGEGAFHEGEEGGQEGGGREGGQPEGGRSGGTGQPDPFLSPDPFANPDPVREVEFALVELASQMDAAMLRFLEGLRTFDEMRGYLLGGFRSTAHWLVGRCGVTLATARERVRVARALAGMPLTAQALGEGRISYSIARALTRTRARVDAGTGAGTDPGPGAAMDAEEEAALLEAAEGRTAGAVEAMVRAWSLKTPEEERERELERMAARTLSLRPRPDGMWEIRGLLTPELGAAVLAAVEGAADTLFREGRPGAAYAARDPRENPHLRVNGVPLARWEAEGGRLPTDVAAALGDRDTAAAARRRRADALGLVCQWALAGAGVGGEAASGDEARSSTSGLRAATTQVVLHVDLEVLRQGGPWADSAESADSADSAESAESAREAAASPATGGTSHLPGSIRVSAETSRRLSCDASVVPLVVRKGLGEERMEVLAQEPVQGPARGPAQGPAREPAQGPAQGRARERGAVPPATAPHLVGLGAATRTVSPSLRRALDARDGGCRFPGCEARHTEAHHVEHWAHGGETSLRNLILLCHHHHTLLHEGGWRMAWPHGLEGVGTPTFFDPLGGLHHERQLRRPPRTRRAPAPGAEGGAEVGPGAEAGLAAGIGPGIAAAASDAASALATEPDPHDPVARMIRANEAWIRIREETPDPGGR